MEEERYRAIRDWFDAYVERFVSADDGLAPLHEMKREHTFRVMENARTIAQALGWPKDEVRTAEVIALLHDVGRFSQLAEFRTFSDRLSVNHAHRSCEVILAEGVLEHLPPSESRRVLAAVESHNRFRIPEDMDADEHRFAALIRDADKIDIYDVAYEAIRTDRIRQHPEIAINLSLERTVSPEVREEVMARKLGSFDKMQTVGDFLVVQLSWIYDLHFVTTAKELQRRGTIERMAGLLPDTGDVRELLDQIRADLAGRLSKDGKRER